MSHHPTGERAERVSYRPEGERRRTIYLAGAHEAAGGRLLTGRHVDRYGKDVAPAGVDEVRRVIELVLVETRIPVTMCAIHEEYEYD